MMLTPPPTHPTLAISLATPRSGWVKHSILSTAIGYGGLGSHFGSVALLPMPKVPVEADRLGLSALACQRAATAWVAVKVMELCNSSSCLAIRLLMAHVVRGVSSSLVVVVCVCGGGGFESPAGECETCNRDGRRWPGMRS